MYQGSQNKLVRFLLQFDDDLKQDKSKKLRKINGTSYTNGNVCILKGSQKSPFTFIMSYFYFKSQITGTKDNTKAKVGPVINEIFLTNPSY